MNATTTRLRLRRPSPRPVLRVVKAWPDDLTIILGRLDTFTPDLTAYHGDIVQSLTDAFIAAVKASSAAIPADRMSEMAAQWALERAGDLLGGKYDIGEATVNRLKELVAQAVANGRPPQEIAHALRYPDPDTGEELFVFSRARAQVIATTETAAALGAGQRQAAIEMGQDQKQWITEDDPCDECQANEDDGWIDIDDSFSSGDDDIPGHPACRCTVIYRTRSIHEESIAPHVVKEARCPRCGGLEARNAPAGVELQCRKRECKTAWTVRT